ncbi:MAG: PadR family transcriptional regulator [Actinomycetota bacterium]|nr:PadR family transcriptional regulator [Actinomycetota bacterium]
MIELAVLGLLTEQDLHGYELRKRLRARLGLFSDLSFGSLYPALGRLEAAGAVTAVEQPAHAPAHSPAGAMPLTGSLSGERAAESSRRQAPVGGRSRRARKVYRLTDRGRELFESLLSGEGSGRSGERYFDLRLAFARHLSREARIRLLERRRAELVRQLDESPAQGTPPTGRLDAYARSVVEHSRQAARHDIVWLDGLLATERSAAAERSAAPNGNPAGIAVAGTPVLDSPSESEESTR